MTVHDSIGRGGYGWARRLRWSRRPRELDRAAQSRQGPGARVRAPYRRQLASIERGLTADAPVLSSKFAMFNRITAGEPAAGVEQVPPPAWPRPRRLRLAVLLVVAAIVALGVIVSALVRPAVPCQVSPTAPTSTATPSGAAARGIGYAPVRALTCRAYANTKQ